MLKRLTLILSAMMTFIVIFSFLLLPKLGFELMDGRKEQDIVTEKADAGTPSQELTLNEKLSMLASSQGYETGKTMRTSTVFLATGKEIAEKDLLNVIKREMELLDPSDSFAFSSEMKVLSETKRSKKNMTATLYNLVRYDENPQSFTVWIADITTDLYMYSFLLDAGSGKILNISVQYVTKEEEPIYDTDQTGSYPPVYYASPLPVSPDNLISFANYFELSDAKPNLSGLDLGESFYCSFPDLDFSLSLDIHSSGCNMQPSLWKQ